MVVLEGRERLKHKMQYSPSRDPMFNGQDKAAGVKMPWIFRGAAPARSFYQYDAWITYFFGPFGAASSTKRRRRLAIMTCKYLCYIVSLAYCPFNYTGLIRVVGGVLGLELVLGLFVDFPRPLIHARCM
jgi:hypothetical protein